MSWLWFVTLAIVALVWVGLKYATPRATPISPDDPIWVAAVARARAGFSEVLGHREAGRELWVKFPLGTEAGTTEHVWGRVISVADGLVECTLETPPVAGSARGVTEVDVHDIEDWQVELEDGTIRGGFTTRAQAEIATRDGRPVPRHVEDMIRRMTD